ncbi:hypothetical protein [Prochlorococcus sp. MIT 1307]|uniref:hypothetical protein n=1 Tax=Prochlorococcus sp. MIT 1307 TaxID=3096219 RepID=UPI002A765926|nr:hypothetical protein [Prochlorococcus sp. MIT 1307]
MLNKKILADSPLSLEEIRKIDATDLPMRERHYLRLLAHCLACFKAMAHESSRGALPSEQERLHWLLAQPVLVDESAFANDLLEQFEVAARILEQLANEYRLSPLELTLDELINSSLRTRQHGRD